MKLKYFHCIVVLVAAGRVVVLVVEVVVVVLAVVEAVAVVVVGGGAEGGGGGCERGRGIYFVKRKKNKQRLSPKRVPVRYPVRGKRKRGCHEGFNLVFLHLDFQTRTLSLFNAATVGPNIYTLTPCKLRQFIATLSAFAPPQHSSVT